MRNRKGWRRWADQVGLQGSIRSLEVVYGQNGPHIHLHLLLFLSFSEKPNASELTSYWKSASLAAGFPQREIETAGFDSHSVDLRDGNKAARYVSKWGLESELTKSHTKRGKAGSRTAFDLLDAYAAGDLEAGELFREHALAFKGKRQLVWSTGLRAKLGLDDEKSDQELMDQPECATKLGEFDLWIWRKVHQNNLQADVLITCERLGWNEAEKLARNAKSQCRPLPKLHKRR